MHQTATSLNDQEYLAPGNMMHFWAFIFHLKYLLFPSFSNWQLLTPFNIDVAEVCTEGEKKASLPAGYRIDTHCF